MSNTPEYHIKRLDKHNIVDVERLHAIVYGKVAAPCYFKKKYSTAYTGVEYVGYIAYNPELIPIAFYAVIPCFLSYHGRQVISAQSADTMTNPNYRFKGLFVELSNLTFELCRNLGIKLIFGFPNQNSYHGAVNKLGWQLTEIMQYFTIPVLRYPWEGLAAKHPALQKLYRSHKKRVLQKHLLTQVGTDNSVANEGFAGIERSGDYLAYKQYSPTQVIKLGNTTVWFKIQNGLTIGDILVNADGFDEVISHLKKLARKLGLKQITFQAMPSTALYKLLAERYQPAPSFPVLFQDWGSGLDLNKIMFTFADIDIF